MDETRITIHSKKSWWLMPSFSVLRALVWLRIINADRLSVIMTFLVNRGFWYRCGAHGRWKPLDIGRIRFNAK